MGHDAGNLIMSLFHFINPFFFTLFLMEISSRPGQIQQSPGLVQSCIIRLLRSSRVSETLTKKGTRLVRNFPLDYPFVEVDLCSNSSESIHFPICGLAKFPTEGSDLDEARMKLSCVVEKWCVIRGR